jgi:hypothetical protein
MSTLNLAGLNLTRAWFGKMVQRTARILLRPLAC